MVLMVVMVYLILALPGIIVDKDYLCMGEGMSES